jgi:hypothetical protein
MAGVGLDAAEYADGDQATAKKRGVFGYDRVTKKADVKNPDQTIVLIMVPPDLPAPWLAGGGATVRGVADADEDPNPLAPFVCLTYPAQGKKSPFDGKRGTLAIMADGKVRFLPADLSPATFRSMCAVAGDKIDKLDSLAPVVGGTQRDLKSGGVGLPPKEGPKEAPKEQPKAVASNNKGKLEGTKWSSKAASLLALDGKTKVELPEGAVLVEFKADKTFSQKGTRQDLQVPAATGKYEFGPGDDVMLEVDDAPIPALKKVTLKVAVKGDEMTLKHPLGAPMTFVKAK